MDLQAPMILILICYSSLSLHSDQDFEVDLHLGEALLEILLIPALYLGPSMSILCV